LKVAKSPSRLDLTKGPASYERRNNLQPGNFSKLGAFFPGKTSCPLFLLRRIAEDTSLL
jgi:hypothetical protein